MPPASAPLLTFRGGLVGALVPFAVFLAGVATLAAFGAPDEKGFWPILVGALLVGLLLSHDRERYCDAMLDGMSQRVVMVMLCAWLLSGLLGAVLSASGFIAALAWAARAAHVTGGAYVAAAFLVCALVSTATGTSFGTLLLAGPLLYPAGGPALADPAGLMGAILAGATFGDSISPVSDTTIASSGSQGADIGGTVRSRLQYALPAGAVALFASALLGGTTRTAAATGALAALDAEPRALAMLLAPALVIVLLLRQRHLIESLLLGGLAAIVLALLLGLMPPSTLLHVAPGAYGATGVLVDGMQRAIGVSVFTLLLVALVGTVQATDALPRLIQAAEGRARGAAAAEWWIVGVVSAAVLITTHSVVAILAVGPFARATGERFRLTAYRRANLLDLTVCTWPFLLPWFLPTIIAASTTRDAGTMGMPSLSPLQIGVHNSYAWALVVMVLLAVTTGYGRRRDTATPEGAALRPRT